LKSKRILPDPAICRTEQMFDDLYDCLVENKGFSRCCHELDFGNKFFCIHPERHIFDLKNSNKKR
jgi:hypothetical protein